MWSQQKDVRLLLTWGISRHPGSCSRKPPRRKSGHENEWMKNLNICLNIFWNNNYIKTLEGHKRKNHYSREKIIISSGWEYCIWTTPEKRCICTGFSTFSQFVEAMKSYLRTSHTHTSHLDQPKRKHESSYRKNVVRSNHIHTMLVLSQGKFYLRDIGHLGNTGCSWTDFGQAWPEQNRSFWNGLTENYCPVEARPPR